MPVIRPELSHDATCIRLLIEAAFADAPHSSRTEATIVDRLREAGALSLSLVAESAGKIVGHVAFSPVAIDRLENGWFGLGPVAVSATSRRQGIGASLIEEGLDRLRSCGAQGCVVLGDPHYYRRFGLRQSSLHYPGYPAEYFQALAFHGQVASGQIAYHPAFS